MYFCARKLSERTLPMGQKLKKRLQIFFRYKDLMMLLVERDIKLRYRRSVLGWV